MSPTPSDADRLTETLLAIEPLDPDALGEAGRRQEQLTKPSGSLGALEPLACRLSGIQAVCPPRALRRPAVAVFAGDHGVHAQGVSPWPQEVTAAMVANFRAGGAAVNVLARQIGAEVVVVDMGVAATLDAGPDLLEHKLRPGTSDLSAGPAMTREEALTGVVAGIHVAETLIGRGVDCLLTGDMGIANTTASAALVAAFTGADAVEVTGRGTGVDDRTLSRKVDIVSGALRRLPESKDVDGLDALHVLAEVGGFEHAGLAGLVLGAAARRTPVVLDGLISGAAALVAQRLAPGAVSFCFAGHRGAEPGHGVALDQLGLTPLLALGLRLGEGTGAALAFPLIEAAGATLREMATFDAAGVSSKEVPA